MPEPSVKKHGPWTIRSTQLAYRDAWIEVDRDEVVRPDGALGAHCVVRMKSGISVLPLDDHGDVFLTNEFHYAIAREALEVVSGGIEEGETALQAAARELREELGIVAARWTSLGTTDPFTTIITSPTALFLAEGLAFTTTAHEGTELITTVKMPLADAARMTWKSEITHAPSCLCILKAFMLRAAHEAQQSIARPDER